MAKLERARSFAPKKYSSQIPKIPTTLRPANKLIPCPIPRVLYIGSENNTAAKANAERQKSLLANRDAAYWG